MNANVIVMEVEKNVGSEKSPLGILSETGNEVADGQRDLSARYPGAANYTVHVLKNVRMIPRKRENVLVRSL